MEKRDELKFAELMALMAEVFDDGRPPSKLKVDTETARFYRVRVGEVEDGS